LRSSRRGGSPVETEAWAVTDLRGSVDLLVIVFEEQLPPRATGRSL